MRRLGVLSNYRGGPLEQGLPTLLRMIEQYLSFVQHDWQTLDLQPTQACFDRVVQRGLRSVRKTFLDHDEQGVGEQLDVQELSWRPATSRSLLEHK